jgi:hypothetical protein
MTALEKENLIDHVRNRYSYQLGIELANFFTQQEKKDKLLMLYRDYFYALPHERKDMEEDIYATEQSLEEERE